MNTLLMILGIILTVVMCICLRSMREDHLYAISIRFEMGVWFIFTISFAGQYTESYHDAVAIPMVLQMVLLGLMISRILTNASFILGNPPKAKITFGSKPPEIDAVQPFRPSMRLPSKAEKAHEVSY